MAEPNELRIDFPHAFPIHVEALSRLLITLRSEIGGDLDLVLILAVIGERHFARRKQPDEPTYDTLGKTETTETPSINAYSIAQFTDIPRETVRRKVGVLVARGWVACDEHGNLSPTEKAATDLAKGTDASIKFIETIIDLGHETRGS